MGTVTNEMLQKDNGKHKKKGNNEWKDKGGIKTETVGQNIAEKAAEMVWTCKNGREKKTQINNGGKNRSRGAKDDWDFRISDLVKNPNGADI